MTGRAIFTALACLAAAFTAGCDRKVAQETSSAAASSDLPDTDIFLGELHIEDGGARIENLRAVVAGPGYANQPMFEAGGASFLFTRQGENAKTDIWRYDIASGALSPVTDSPDRSEYSPKPAPGGGVSYIQETPDGVVTRVHRNGVAVVDLEPLGYYEWLGGGAALGVFFRSEPPELRLVDVETGENRPVAASIGRALQAAPSGEVLYFTSSAEGGANWLYRIGREAAAATPVLEMPGEGEDYRLIFDTHGAPLGLFAADGVRLVYRALPAREGDDWAVVYDAGSIGAASRIAVSDDHKRITLVLEAVE